jgi:hypothetical protein
MSNECLAQRAHNKQNPMLQISLLLIVTFLSASNIIQAVPDKNRGWSAGVYRGLIIGTSTRADMLRVLGKPLSSGPTEGQGPPKPIIWNDYGMIKGEISGQLAVEVDSRTNRIVTISISPEKMSKEEAIKYFGNDYVLIDYEFCPGQSLDADVGLVYENPRGTEIDYLEYRSRGIAIHLDYQGNVNGIYYLDKPLGLASKADCKRALEKSKSRRR